jgi:hypothetical protein
LQCLQEWDDCGVLAFDRRHVCGRVIGGAVLPDSKEDANPAHRKLTQGRVMLHASALLQAVVGPAPWAPLSRMIGELVKCLTQVCAEVGQAEGTDLCDQEGGQRRDDLDSHRT